ncbi:MAG: hypothetical protein JWO82_656, partial [Akkermansiaceae bacterium]|nr:hypothetical protein [Akkermansiaceae bacterium]
MKSPYRPKPLHGPVSLALLLAAAATQAQVV